MNFRARLYLATFGRLRLAPRERKLIQEGFWRDAVKLIYERTGCRLRTAKILHTTLGLEKDEAKRLVWDAMFLE